jgi:hypothetical protein
MRDATFFRDESTEELAGKIIALTEAGQELAHVTGLPTWESSVKSLLAQFGIEHSTQNTPSELMHCVPA